MLHIIKNSAALDNAMAYSQPNDQFILLEDAVFALISEQYGRSLMLSLSERCFALEVDLEARGIVSDLIELVDFTGFVELTEQHQTNITWG